MKTIKMMDHHIKKPPEIAKTSRPSGRADCSQEMTNSSREELVFLWYFTLLCVYVMFVMVFILGDNNEGPG